MPNSNNIQINKTSYTINVTDSYNDKFVLSFKKNEYANLRELIEENYPEEFGACKGKGLCGTCAVRSNKEIKNDFQSATEIEILKKNNTNLKNTRLACQVQANKTIDKMTFKILTEE
ncbi:2Fe-2S iron-sulfur cluster-binding protein [Flavicella sediminum]|uniref:2Fe-2S iron-sulfur cluster-binding protein n=1 Tax=Flavicella sediminum TaxID=2585141 RepID=UPI00111F23C5|nr:2Fe-2S iron-sulfur cluster-binding protein [Flavicella sediminum]